MLAVNGQHAKPKFTRKNDKYNPWFNPDGMGPIGHAVISSGVGVGVGLATGSPEAGALALGVGVLMDVDHAYDFYRWYAHGDS